MTPNDPGPALLCAAVRSPTATTFSLRCCDSLEKRAINQPTKIQSKKSCRWQQDIRLTIIACLKIMQPFSPRLHRGDVQYMNGSRLRKRQLTNCNHLILFDFPLIRSSYLGTGIHFAPFG